MSSDEARIDSALTLMEDNASAWALAYETAINATWADFCDDVLECFGKTDRARNARLQLHQLRQTGSAANYNYHFITIKQKIPNLDEEQAVFYYEA
ncbi:hypothetical protein FBU30_001711, partial [Linnemannia zychae]